MHLGKTSELSRLDSSVSALIPSKLDLVAYTAPRRVTLNAESL